MSDDAPIDPTTLTLRPPGGEAPDTAEHLSGLQAAKQAERQAAADARNGAHHVGHHALNGRPHARVLQAQKLTHYHRKVRAHGGSAQAMRAATLKPLTLTSVPTTPTASP